MSVLRWYLLCGLVSVFILVGRVAYGQATERDNNQSVVYLPLIASYEIQATPKPPAQRSGRIFGLSGKLQLARNQRFDFYFVTNDGATYGIVGETPAIEEQIAAMGDLPAPASAKVWGTIYPQNDGDNADLIVASGILASSTTVATPPTATPQSAIATVRFELVNLYDGPGVAYDRVGQVRSNQTCTIVGRDRLSLWWQLRCGNNVAGWIDRRLVTLQGEISSVPVTDASALATATPRPTGTPTPRPTPTTYLFRNWKTSIFDNPDLLGQPVAMADVSDIDFNWGATSPSQLAPEDNFSLRFERTMSFTPGYHRIVVQADDGVRIWLDDQLIIDEWSGASGQTRAIGRELSGDHELRVEYREFAGQASIRFRIEYLGLGQALIWSASYYNSPSLSGAAAIVQREPGSQNPLDFNWGYASPLPGVVREDQWSARWTGTFRFERGDYVFRANADDGVRVYVDGAAVIDRWQDQYKEATNRFLDIGEGNHTVTVEYYDRIGSSILKVWWFKETSE